MINPFENITEREKLKLIELLKGHVYYFEENDDVLSVIKNKNIVCILLEGYAQILNINYNGDEMLISDLYENSVFGTYISDINNLDCEIQAKSKSKILVFDYANFSNPKNTSYSYYNIFINNMFDIICNILKENNYRTRILSKKNIRDKILEFLEIEYEKKHTKYIYLPMSLKDLADYLSINRSAMFRELKYLKEDGIIKIDGRKITLVQKKEPF